MPKPYSIVNIETRLRKYTTIVDIHWLYTNRLSNKGYGIIKYLRRQLSVHRLSAHLYLGLDLDSSMMSLHKTSCPYKNCWNPDCLYAGTHTDNMNDIRKLNTCSKCGQSYDSVVGRIRRCRSCHNEYQRKYRKTRRAKVA